MSGGLRWVLLVAALVFLLLVTWTGEAILRGIGFGFGDSLKTLDYLWIAIATIIGVFASVMVSGLRQLPQDKRVRFEQLVDIFLRPGCLIALCVSPVVFYGVILSTAAHTGGAAALLAAFQNGFFWEQVLRTQSKAVGQAEGQA